MLVVWFYCLGFIVTFAALLSKILRVKVREALVGVHVQQKRSICDKKGISRDLWTQPRDPSLMCDAHTW